MENQDKDGGLFVSQALPMITAGVSQTDVVTVFVEGMENSTAINDLTLKAKFSMWVGSVSAENKQTSIAPIIRDFKITSTNGPTAIKNSQGVVVGIGAGSQALDGGAPGSGGPGLAITGDLTTGGLPARGRFVQVVMGVDNGFPSGFELVSGAKGNFQLTGGLAFGAAGLNDAPTPQTIPYYPEDTINDDIPNPVGRKVMYIIDTPSFGVTNGADPLKRANITFRAKTYLVWTYSDGTLFTLATLSWRVVLEGASNAGQFIIAPASKIVADGGYVRTHQDPSKLIAPTFNSKLGYVAVP